MPKTTQQVMILTGKYDEEVVERFNKLVSEEKIDLGFGGLRWTSAAKNFRARLRPAPRYRPFTAVEAAEHIERRVVCGVLNGGVFGGYFMAGQNGILIGDITCKRVSYEEAVTEVAFEDTGEPFGVKEE